MAAIIVDSAGRASELTALYQKWYREHVNPDVLAVRVPFRSGALASELRSEVMLVPVPEGFLKHLEELGLPFRRHEP